MSGDPKTPGKCPHLMASCGLQMPVRANGACVCCWAQGEGQTPFLVHREGMGTLLGTAKPWLTGCLQGGWACTGCTLWKQRQAGLGVLWCCAHSHMCVLWHRCVHTSAGPYVEVEETWWARGARGPRGARIPRGTSKTLQWSSVEIGLGYFGCCLLGGQLWHPIYVPLLSPPRAQCPWLGQCRHQPGTDSHMGDDCSVNLWFLFAILQRKREKAD